MAKDVMVGAHGCVIGPKVKGAGLEVDDKHGRMSPGLSACGVDESAMTDRLVFAEESSP